MNLDNLLGLHAEKLEAYQMAVRVVIVFIAALFFIRIAGIRTLGSQSTFDKITAIVLGTILGNAVFGNQTFFGYLLAALVLMLLHRLIAWVTFKSKTAGAILKGENLLLMKDGVKQKENLSKVNITEEDILEALRRDANITSLDKIKEVYLERSGDISLIKK